MIPNVYHSEIEEISEKFQPKRRASIFLSESFNRLGYETKFNRIKDCGSFLTFAHELYDDGTINPEGLLYKANFCKDRLCPMCAWRRSLKLYGQISQIADNLEGQYEYLFLTLTVPNVGDDDLLKTIEDMTAAYNRMFRRSIFKGGKRDPQIVYGTLRVLEITRNNKTGLWHPHFHVILAVCKDYFSGRKYIRQGIYQKIWTECYCDISGYQLKKGLKGLVVDIRKTYGLNDDEYDLVYESGIREAAKYSVKSGDYLHYDDLDLTDQIVEFLSSILYHKRMIQFTGVFKDEYDKEDFEDVDSDNSELVRLGHKFNPLVSHFVQEFGFGAFGYSLIRNYVMYPDGEKSTR